ncbi:hypothetical protein, partial [Bacillus safensis]|uniref:hypothetical protein n=1 Tax=Bacillus safensis TaxID=561879 RepID=UPI002E1E850A|nr:hypothetical protein [Bacillus safensis]
PGWTHSIYLYIKSTPYEKDSIYLEYIFNYCKELVDHYKHCYDPGDPYSDLPASYNVYTHAKIDYDYVPSETRSEDILNDMKLFDSSLEAKKIAEKEKKDREFELYLLEEQKKEIEDKKRAAEYKKKKQIVESDLTVKELDEENQYYILDADFAKLNKRKTLAEYQEEVAAGESYSQNVLITKEVFFSSEEAYLHFTEMLLSNFEFLNNTGGSYTEDNRFTSEVDYYQMEKHERDTVEWASKGVGVYFNDVLMFIIDSQGYSYARYVGLVDNAYMRIKSPFQPVLSESQLNKYKVQADNITEIALDVIYDLNIHGIWIDEKWTLFKNKFKSYLQAAGETICKEAIRQIDSSQLDFKKSFYKILYEIDSIQEQFTNSGLEKGEKITLVHISDWGCIQASKVTLDSFINTKYAQYDKAVKVVFKPERKRKLFYNHFYADLLVFRGWHDIPITVLYEEIEENNMVITRSKFLSCDKKQFEAILAHFDKQNIKPVINTVN